MTEKRCPSDQDLKAYALGQLRLEEIDQVAEHVDTCPPCEDTVANLESLGDTVMTGLRSPATSEVADDDQLQRALSFVRKIGEQSSADASAANDTAPPIGHLREYELLEKLGEGGMGAVYKARHGKLDKIVAIKILPAEKMKDPQAVARFEREMRAVGKLDHPNIVRAMDAGEVDGMHFLVMEYVQGQDLSQISKQHGPLPVNTACELIRQAAVGLDEAYDNDMVHRDIKPSNLMLTQGSRSGGRGTRKKSSSRNPRSSPRVKILDMGLALLSDAHSPDNEGLTTTGQMMGTLDYMAPEQGGDSKNVDIRADIYALGASLYRLLCGQAIYHGEKYATPIQKLTALIAEPAPPIQDRVDGIPDELAAIVHRMLEKDPAARYASPQEVVDALAPFCGDADLSSLLTGDALSRELTEGSMSATELGASSGSVDTEITEDLPSAGLSSDKGRDSTQVGAPTIIASSPAKPQAAAQRRIPTGFLIAGGAGLLGIAALLAAMVLFFQTPNGTLRVEIADPDVEVKVKGENIVLTNADQEPVKLKAGEHSLIVTRGDFTFETKQFTLSKGETTTVRVELLPGKVQVVSNDRLIGERPMDSSEVSPRSHVDYMLEFDGHDDFAKLPLVYHGSYPLTIEARVMPKRADSSGTVAGNAVNQGFPLGITAENRWRAICYSKRRQIVDSKAPHPMDKPTFSYVAAVLADRQLRLFVDGELQGTKDLPSSPNASPLQYLLGADHLAKGKQHNYFCGKIDEVRFSKVARYKRNYVPKRHLTSDADTLALYHFDEGSGDVLRDSSGNGHHGKIVGAKWVRVVDRPKHDPPKQFALRFDEDEDHVMLPVRYRGDHPVTIEARVRLNHWHKHEQTEIVVGDFQQGGVGLLHEGDKGWHFLMHGEAYTGILHPHEIEDRFVHIAGSYDGKLMRLFVDGVLVGAEPLVASTVRPSPLTFCIGANPEPGEDQIPVASGKLDGDVRSVRISTTARYLEPFEPPSSKFEPDKHTLALYHFDEGAGDVLHDSSGNGHHGKIVGAKWVRVDGKSVESTDETPWDEILPADAPPPAVAQFDADAAKRHQQAWADYLSVPVEKEVVVGKDEDGEEVTLTMVLIPPGEFMMGINDEDRAKLLEVAGKDKYLIDMIHSAGPQHRVRITRPFYLGKYEVTQAQWQSVVGENPSAFQDNPNHPVENLHWHNVQPFLARLNDSEFPTIGKFALPTEAQWEYACRAGTSSVYSFGDEAADMARFGWTRENSGDATHPVGKLESNAFGLHDMHGNVWEWCADFYSADYYARSPVDDPVLNYGPTLDARHVDRGGSWTSFAAYCHLAVRAHQPGHRIHNVGFRLAASIDVAEPTAESSDSEPQTPDEKAFEYVREMGGRAYWKDDPRRLTHVILEHRQEVTDEGLKVFQNCKDVERLVLSWTGVSDHALAHFENCTKLESIGLGPTTTDAALAYLPGFPNLKDLSLGARRDQISIDGLKHLRNCPKLTHFKAWWNVFTDENIQEVKHWPHLQSLSLREQKELTDKGLVILHDLKQLRELQITKTNLISDSALNELRAALPECEVQVDRFIYPARWIPLLTKEPTFAQWTIESDDGCLAEYEDDRLKVQSPDAGHEARIARYVERDGILLHVEMWKAHDGRESGVRMQLPNSAYVDLHSQEKRELWRDSPKGEAKLEQSQAHMDNAQAGEWIATQYVLLDDELTVYSQGKKLFSQPLLETELIKFQLVARNATAYFRNVAIMKLRGDQFDDIRAGRLPTYGAQPSTEVSQSPDRTAAEWVKSISRNSNFIKIRQDGVERFIKDPALREFVLPEGPFELTGVCLMYNEHLTEEGFAKLKGCRNLKILRCGYTSVPDAWLEGMEDAVANLEELYLDGGATTAAGLAAFKDCEKITSLNLTHMKPTAEGLQHFSKCKHLRVLFLGGTSLDDVSLEAFAGCTELERLDVRNTGMNGAELVHFKNCEELSSVDLSRVRSLDKAALENLKNCNLKWLNVGDTDIDDEALAFLNDHQQLEYLNIAGTKVSDDFVKALQESLPDCEISR